MDNNNIDPNLYAIQRFLILISIFPTPQAATKTVTIPANRVKGLRRASNMVCS